MEGEILRGEHPNLKLLCKDQEGCQPLGLPPSSLSAGITLGVSVGSVGAQGTFQDVAGGYRVQPEETRKQELVETLRFQERQRSHSAH